MPNQLPDLSRRNLLIDLAKDAIIRVAEYALQIDEEADQAMNSVQAALDEVTAKVETIQVEQKQEQAALWEIVRQLESLRDRVDALQPLAPERRQRRAELLERITKAGIAFVSALGGALLGAMVQEDVYPKLKWALEWWMTQSGGSPASSEGLLSTPAPEPVPPPIQTPTVVNPTSSSTPTPPDESAAPVKMRWIVAPSGGDFDSIRAAVNTVPTGSELLIKPGVYQETFSIWEEMYLIGDGQREDIVIESQYGPIITFRAESGTVRNLTLRMVGTETEYICALIRGGSLLLQDCDLSSGGGRVIEVSGHATPTVRNNRIHDSQQSGVVVHENGAGLFEGNDIFGNGDHGVAVAEGGNPTVRNNRISANKKHGIKVLYSGKGNYTGNNLRRNRDGALQISWLSSARSFNNISNSNFRFRFVFRRGS